jgi:RHS repeat-associated protein
MLDHLGLVHMNGRIYDPHIGRFLSPDPFIQFPGIIDGYNRYSYVLNNPLKYTDPSGYSLLDYLNPIEMAKRALRDLKKYWRPILAIVVGVVTAGMAAWLYLGVGTFWGAVGSMFAGSIGFGGGVLAGAVGGFFGGFVATGTLKGALIGAFTGAAAGAVGGLFRMEGVSNFFGRFTETARAMAHGLTGGAAAEMSGASFSSGFLAGSFGSLAGSYGHDWGNVAANTLQAAVVGGTASVIGGGKFENGAVTAAFQHLFNHEVGKAVKRDRIIQDYLEVEDYIKKYHKKHADSPIPLSESQFNAILKYNALAVSETGRFVSRYRLQWNGDSIFRSYGDTRFMLEFEIGNLAPGIHRAGDINYIVQGMLHAHGWNLNRAIMVQNIFMWNTAQGLGFRGECHFDKAQIDGRRAA